jgi:N-acetylmuramoyl-L-alanine amidase
VLVECGFLSNPDEAAKFENEEYRKKVAFTLFCSITEYLQAENE